jgi:hypothetical protein
MTMKGLQKQASGRAIALRFLSQYIQKTNNGGNVHLFTGTPVTNTLTEVYHMMRYIMEDDMKAAAVDTWDGWFGAFASEETDLELGAAGQYEAVTRLSSFINIPELRQMLGQYMDVVFSDTMPEMQPRETKSGKTYKDDLTELEKAELENGRTEGATDRPYKKVIIDNADMTEEQESEFKKLQGYARKWNRMSGRERYEAKNKGAPESPIITEGMAATASMDVRRMYPENAGQEGKTKDDPNSKASRVIKNVLEIYNSHEHANQAIFLDKGIIKGKDKFSTAWDIIERLVQQGIPRDEIAVVTGETSKDERKAIAEEMNRSEIRVVLGSSGSLGIGVNMQENLRAMHHVDAPYMPGQLEQRNGRGHRQGNQWNTVLEYRYLTDKLDGRRWQILSIKQKFIDGFLKFKGTGRTLEGDAANEEGVSFMDTFGEAAGDPRILLREKYKQKVEKLQRKERIYTRSVADSKVALREVEKAINDETAELEQAKQIEPQIDKALENNTGDNFTAEIGGKTYTKRKDADEAIKKIVADKVRVRGKPVPLGTLYGFEAFVSIPSFSDAAAITLQVPVNGKHVPVSSRSPSIASLSAALRGIRGGTKKVEKWLADMHGTKDRLTSNINTPFKGKADLQQARDLLNSLEMDMDKNPVAPPAWLRNGAPVDTDVVWNDKTFEVVGHRWGKDNWYVIAADSKGELVIPYDEVKDPQGMPIYEPREFVEPEVISQSDNTPQGSGEVLDRELPDDEGQYSILGVAPGQPLNKTALDKKLRTGIAGKAIGSLIDSGKVVIHDTSGTFPGKFKGAHAVTLPDGTIHLAANRLSPSSALPVLLHEAFHAGVRPLIGSDQWDKLQGGLKALYGQGERSQGKAREFWDKAMERVLWAQEKGVPLTEEQMIEEFGAYAIEEYASAPRTIKLWVDRFIGYLKAWGLRVFGKQFGQMTPAQLRSLAVMALRDRSAARMAAQAEAYEHSGSDGMMYSFGKPNRPEDSFSDLNDKQKSFLKKIGFGKKKSWAERKQELTENLGRRIRQAGVDRRYSGRFHC